MWKTLLLSVLDNGQFRAEFEQRLAAIEAWKEQLESRLVTLAKDIAENTRMTNAIKSDTSQIVALFKASQLGASLVKWCAGLGSAIIIAYAAWKGIK